VSTLAGSGLLWCRMHTVHRDAAWMCTFVHSCLSRVRACVRVRDALPRAVINSYRVVDGHHYDLFQGWASTGNVLRGNIMRAFTDRDQPYLLDPVAGVSDAQGCEACPRWGEGVGVGGGGGVELHARPRSPPLVIPASIQAWGRASPAARVPPCRACLLLAWGRIGLFDGYFDSWVIEGNRIYVREPRLPSTPPHPRHHHQVRHGAW
jgi:hypothetical protein